MSTTRRNRRVLIGGAVAVAALTFVSFAAFAVFASQALDGGANGAGFDRPELGIGLAVALGLAFVLKLAVFLLVGRAALRFVRDRAGRGPGQWYGSFGWQPADGGRGLERSFGPSRPGPSGGSGRG